MTERLGELSAVFLYTSCILSDTGRKVRILGAALTRYGYVLQWHLDWDLCGSLRHGHAGGPDGVT